MALSRFADLSCHEGTAGLKFEAIQSSVPGVAFRTEGTQNPDGTVSGTQTFF